MSAARDKYAVAGGDDAESSIAPPSSPPPTNAWSELAAAAQPSQHQTTTTNTTPPTLRRQLSPPAERVRSPSTPIDFERRREPPRLNIARHQRVGTEVDGIASPSGTGEASPIPMPTPMPTTPKPARALLVNVESVDRENTLHSSSALTTSGTSSPGLLLHRPSVLINKKPPISNKSKLMAMMGEALPQNALDLTGYEQHEEDAKRKEDAVELAAELQEGLVELDAFGNPIFKTWKSRVKVQLRKRFRGCWKVYDPASPNRQYWSLLVVLFLLYGMIEIPIRIGFEMDVTPWSAPDLFNLFVDIFFLVDVFMNFRTGFYQEDSRLVLDERKIAHRYLKSWFALDIITSIPISQILQAALNGGSSGLAFASLPRILRIFRIARLFKILRMLKLMNVMSSWSESSNEKIFSLMIKVMKFVVLVFLLSHLSGCVWGYIALQQQDSNGNFHHLSWPYRYGIYTKRDTSFSHMYLLSLYWSLCTLTTVGYGDIHAGSSYEYAFCIILTFVGCNLFGYIIGTISSILKHGKETEALYLHKMLELNLYMTYRKISPYLQKKIRKHYEYLWRRQTLYNEDEILSELPNYLKSDVSLFLYKDLIEKVPFLADMGADCAMMVVLKLKPLQFIPGAFVYTRGQCGREMFFVSKGTVEVINSSGFIVCQLTEGAYHGEHAILSEKPVYRTVSVRARTFVDLLSLSKTDFEAIWGMYPEIYAKIIMRAKEQWQQVIQGAPAEGELAEGGLPASTAEATPAKAKAVDDSPRKAPIPRGDTVIRIEKSHDIGSERRLLQQKHGEESSAVEMAGLQAPTAEVDGATTDRADDHTDEDEDDDDDDDDQETSYIDSLEGLSSENDEDYDVRRDHIDLPEHLLPPPKPIIRGSFVQAGRNTDGGGEAKVEEKKEVLTIAAEKIKTFFGARAEVASPKAHGSRLALKKSDTLASPTANIDKRRSNRKSGGVFPSHVQDALKAAPPAEGGPTTPKSAPAVPNQAGAPEVSQVAAHSYAANGNGSASRLTGTGADGRGSVFSTMYQSHLGGTSFEPIATIHEAPGADGTEGDLEGEDATAMPPTAGAVGPSAKMSADQKTVSQTNGSSVLNSSPSSGPASESPPSPLVISTYSTPQLTDAKSALPSVTTLQLASTNAVPPAQSPVQPASQPTPDHFLSGSPASAPRDEVSMASDPQFWTALQGMLAQTLQPLQDQYTTLVTAHSELQAKHARTEQLLRTLAEKLKESREQNARATAAAAASASGSPPVDPSTNRRATNSRRSGTRIADGASVDSAEEKKAASSTSSAVHSRHGSLTSTDALNASRRKSLRTLGIDEHGEDMPNDSLSAHTMSFLPARLAGTPAPALSPDAKSKSPSRK